MPSQEAGPPLVVRAKAPFALLFLLGGVFFFACVVGLAALLLGGRRPVTWDVWAFFFGPVALFMGGFGAWFLAVGSHCIGLRVEVTPSGVEQSNLLSRTSWKWAEVETLWYNADGMYLQQRRPTGATYTLVNRGGRRMRLVGFYLEGADRLDEALLGEIRRHLMTAARRHVQAGESVSFGPLRLGREGLSGPAGLLPWAELAGVELVNGGRVVVRRTGEDKPWFVSRMSRVPNIPVLFALVAEWGLRGGAAALPADEELEAPPAAGEWRLDRVDAERLEVLGNPDFVCKPVNDPGQQLLGALVCFSLALLSVLAGVIIIAFFQASFSQSLPANIVGGCAVLFGLVVGAFGLVLRREAGQASFTLHVFPHGFACVDSTGVWLCPWDRVCRVWAAVTLRVQDGQFAGKSQRYTVERDDGQKRVITGALSRVGDFHARLQKETMGRLLAEAARDLREGRTVDFGDIQATRHGLRVGKEKHPWPPRGPEVLQAGIIRLPREGQSPAVVFASDVANLSVFLELLRKQATA